MERKRIDMLNLNQEKIIAHFGSRFYDDLIRKLAHYTKLWALTSLHQVDYYSANCVFSCESEMYGPCILKCGRPSVETSTEYHTLVEYGGEVFCQLYEADIPNAVLLIERLIPGVQLRALRDLDKRLDVFIQVYKNLHIRSAKESRYPTYQGWVTRIAEYMRGRKDYQELAQAMQRADLICQELNKQYTDQVLLHGDLHHDNILLASDGRYRVIDPKGVVGDPVFDIPRFILNEFEDPLSGTFSEHFKHICRRLSAALNIPEADIKRLTYVEMCMGHAWCVEGGEEPNLSHVRFTAAQLD